MVAGVAAVAVIGVGAVVVLGGGDDGNGAPAAAATTTIAGTATPAPGDTGAGEGAGATTVAESATTIAGIADLTPFVGSWIGPCEPYIALDGASSGGWIIEITGPNTLALTAQGFEYETADCSDSPPPMVFQTYELTVVGTGVVEGVEVIKVTEPTVGKDILGIDGSGRLRFGEPGSPTDAEGFPNVFGPVDPYSGTRA